MDAIVSFGMIKYHEKATLGMIESSMEQVKTCLKIVMQ